MTTVYFVRHAEPNYENHDDLTRELSSRGLEDRKLVTRFLNTKGIDVVLSSPYKRAVDTVKDFADANGLGIIVIEDLRERCVGNEWIDDFNGFCQKQWGDFGYKLLDGENLREVQDRNITALRRILKDHKDKNIAIGSHGTAISTIINFFDSSFGYKDFEKIKALMPWIVRFSFEGAHCVEIEKYNLFEEIDM